MHAFRRRPVHAIIATYVISGLILGACTSGQVAPGESALTDASTLPASATPRASESAFHTSGVGASDGPSESDSPTSIPTASPEPTAAPTPQATPRPTPRATPKSTAAPPPPTPTPAWPTFTLIPYNASVAQGGDQLIYVTPTAIVPYDSVCKLTVTYADSAKVVYDQTVLAQWSFTLSPTAAVGTASASAVCSSASSHPTKSWGPAHFEVVAAP